MPSPTGTCSRSGSAVPGRACAPSPTGEAYINFQTADEDRARIEEAYGANFRRLLELKRRYDPDNLFRVNRNIAT